MQQDSAVNRTYHFSLSSSLLYDGAYSSRISSFSSGIPRSLPSGQFKIPGQPGLLFEPVELSVHLTYSMCYIHVAGCVEEILPLNI